MLSAAVSNWLILLLATSLCIISASAIRQNSDDLVDLDLAKRPFCGFSGCGTKRSDETAAASTVEEVEKRPFCNGFRGCNNKRGDTTSSSSEAEKTVEKKPFCNSFRGCASKRSDDQVEVGKDAETVLDVKKRPFCNGFRGCGNGPVKKHNSVEEKQDQLWNRLLDRIRQLRQMRKKRPFCNGFTGCNS